jgi:AraC family transcriptional regulator
LSDFQLKRAIDYIRSNLDAQLSLENITAELNLSHYYFCSLFKQSMGVSPWQYVIRQRVERAKELLNNRALSIFEFALACGFSNQSHLNKHFRSATGIAPGINRRG